MISGQPTPNLLAIKEINPDRVLSIYTKQSKKVMIDLEKVLSADRILPSIEVDAYDYNSVYSKLDDFIKNCKDEVIINFTGGTKLMSISAFFVGQKYNKKLVYIDSEDKMMLEYNDRNVFYKKLNSKISIQDYFKIHGIHFYKTGNVIYTEDEFVSMKRFSEMILKNPKVLSDSLALTRKILSTKRKAKDNWLKENEVITSGMNSFEWKNGKGTLIYNLDGQRIVYDFKGINFLEYHNGKWFEEKIYEALKEHDYDELVMNFEILNEAGLTINELDIIGIKNGKLEIFECKSGGVFQEDLNKLKAIKDTLGKYSSLNLVTYYKLNGKSKAEKVAIEKLKDYHINNLNYYHSNLKILEYKKTPNL